MAHCLLHNYISKTSLNYLEIQAGDADIVYAMVVKVLTENKVPLDKVIGICSDGASTMQARSTQRCLHSVSKKDT